MTYIYDLVLNFNSELFEFYEWEEDDKLYHIKKIYLVKIDCITYNDILDNKIIIDDKFLLGIVNKCEYFENKKIITIPYSMIITDSYRAMAIMMDSKGNIIKYSSLLLDEEEDVLEVSDRLATVKIDYIIKEKKKNTLLTRKEKNIIKYIKKDLNNSYKNKNINKLKYLYYEYFNKESDDINEIYYNLIKILDQKIDKKIYNLYNLIKLSLMHKNA